MDDLSPAQRRRSLFLDLVQAAAFLFVALLVHALPLKTAYRLADFLGELIFSVWKRRAEIARRNIRIAFGHEWGERRIEATARAAFRNIARTALETFLTPRLITSRSWIRSIHLDVSVDATLRLLVERKSPVALVSGHYGNWEVLGYTLAAFGFANTSIVRPLDNRFVNQMLTGARERAGQKIISKFGAGDQVRRIFDQKGIVCLLADPNAGRKGVFVDFFGVKASAHKALASLCVAERIPVVVGICRRRPGDFQFEVFCSVPIRPEEFDGMDRLSAGQAITQRVTRELEMFVRQDPTQYMWTFRRFKARTRAEERAADNIHRDREDDILAAVAG
jgi:KDO2-lipid IV(A) lauroyltransferase